MEDSENQSNSYGIEHSNSSILDSSAPFQLGSGDQSNHENIQSIRHPPSEVLGEFADHANYNPTENQNTLDPFDPKYSAVDNNSIHSNNNQGNTLSDLESGSFNNRLVNTFSNTSSPLKHTSNFEFIHPYPQKFDSVPREYYYQSSTADYEKSSASPLYNTSEKQENHLTDTENIQRQKQDTFSEISLKSKEFETIQPLPKNYIEHDIDQDSNLSDTQNPQDTFCCEINEHIIDKPLQLFNETKNYPDSIKSPSVNDNCCVPITDPSTTSPIDISPVTNHLESDYLHQIYNQQVFEENIRSLSTSPFLPNITTKISEAQLDNDRDIVPDSAEDFIGQLKEKIDNSHDFEQSDHQYSNYNSNSPGTEIKGLFRDFEEKEQRLEFSSDENHCSAERELSHIPNIYPTEYRENCETSTIYSEMDPLQPMANCNSDISADNRPLSNSVLTEQTPTERDQNFEAQNSPSSTQYLLHTSQDSTSNQINSVKINQSNDPFLDYRDKDSTYQNSGTEESNLENSRKSFETLESDHQSNCHTELFEPEHVIPTGTFNQSNSPSSENLDHRHNQDLVVSESEAPPPCSAKTTITELADMIEKFSFNSVGLGHNNNPNHALAQQTARHVVNGIGYDQYDHEDDQNEDGGHHGGFSDDNNSVQEASEPEHQFHHEESADQQHFISTTTTITHNNNLSSPGISPQSTQDSRNPYLGEPKASMMNNGKQALAHHGNVVTKPASLHSNTSGGAGPRTHKNNNGTVPKQQLHPQPQNGLKLTPLSGKKANYSHIQSKCGSLSFIKTSCGTTSGPPPKQDNVSSTGGPKRINGAAKRNHTSAMIVRSTGDPNVSSTGGNSTKYTGNALGATSPYRKPEYLKNIKSKVGSLPGASNGPVCTPNGSITTGNKPAALMSHSFESGNRNNGSHKTVNKATNGHSTHSGGSVHKPDLKNVKSKIGSLQNAAYTPAGGKVKIQSYKLDFKEKAAPKIQAKLTPKTSPPVELSGGINGTPSEEHHHRQMTVH